MHRNGIAYTKYRNTFLPLQVILCFLIPQIDCVSHASTPPLAIRAHSPKPNPGLKVDALQRECESFIFSEDSWQFGETSGVVSRWMQLWLTVTLSCIFMIPTVLGKRTCLCSLWLFGKWRYRKINSRGSLYWAKLPWYLPKLNLFSDFSCCLLSICT